ncbi:LysR family transcriptional regulator [Photobacterium sagamiensis]|uniref:LysR family transcriptional regulator n=1 Tax=Photobacterium sagamiensis TaxID=2910241 RepID=UPI003D0C236F
MKLEDIELFVHVADHMSFTDAANDLDLPQPSVSRKIKQLEDGLKVRLFERTSRKICLTEQGVQFYKHCKVILDELSTAKETLADYQNEPSGTLTLCISPLFAELLSRKFFSQFMKAFPEIKIVYKAFRPEDLEKEFEYDLMFYIHPPKDQSMIARRVLNCPRRFYASPAYLDKCGYPEHPSELSNHNCLIFDSKIHPTDKFFYLENGHLEFVQVDGTFISDSMNLTMDLAVQGHGVCWVPQQLADNEVRKGNLVCLFGGKYAIEQSYYVIYSSRRYMAKKVKVFLDMFTQYMEQTHNIFDC